MVAALYAGGGPAPSSISGWWRRQAPAKMVDVRRADATFLSLVLAAAISGCARSEGTTAPNPERGPSMAELDRDLTAVAGARVYFNHQSVGFNILHGVERLGKVPITQAKLDAPAAFGDKGIVHTTLGVNTDPASKIEGFRQALTAMPEPPDVALMKFCYIDFDQRTDSGALFARYKQTLDELARRFPTTRFMHVTVPLVVAKPKWKRVIKDALGRGDDSYANARRDAFSELVRQTYPPERVFDLARVESTRRDGSTEGFERDGRQIPALVAGYSDDGAHLDPAGQDLAARAFVQKIAAVLRAR
jgi:hypothetical protein